MKKLLYICVGLILVVAVWVLLQVVSHGHPTPAAFARHQLSIVTYNTGRIGMFEHAEHNLVIRYLQHCDADILCLQEVEVYKSEAYLTLPELKNAMKEYPYTYFDFKVYNARRQYGNVVFSRYPLIHKHTIPYTSRGNISSSCDVVVGEDTLRLFVNHLESNRIVSSDNRDSILGKIGAAGRIRWRQAWQVKKATWESPYPVVVAGDFNATPLSLTYQCLRLGLRDCFLSASCSQLGNTYVRRWHGLPIGARIDYILCSRCITATRCVVEKVPGSDHYPLRAELEW